MSLQHVRIVLMVLIVGFALLGEAINGRGLQPVLPIVLWVLLALLYAGALLIYRREGMSTKAWYIRLGMFIVVLLVFVLGGFLGRSYPFILYTPAVVIAGTGRLPAKR